MNVKKQFSALVLAAISFVSASSLNGQTTIIDSHIPLGQLAGDNLHPDFTRVNVYSDPHNTRELWLAWDAGTSVERHVYVRQYDEPQQQWGTPIAITAGSGVNQYPDIENLGDSILVVWECNQRGNFDLSFRLFDGNTWSAPAFIISDTTDDRKPVLFSQHRDFENGRWDHTALVVWERGAKFMWSLFDGHAWSLPQNVPSTLDSAKSAQIGMNFGEFPFMVWEGLSQNNWDLYGSWFVPDSNVWAAPVRLTTQSAEDRMPQIGSAGIFFEEGMNVYRGGAQVIWQTNADGNEEIYSGYFSISDDPPALDIKNISQHDSADSAPTVQFISGGDYYFATTIWQSNRTGFEDLVSDYLYQPHDALPGDAVPDHHPVLSQSVGYNPASHWLAWERFEAGAWSIYGLLFIQSYVVGAVTDKNLQSPSITSQLVQNYPNPFNPETRIVFYVPPGAEKQRVLIKIYDVLGRLAAVLFDREVAPGRYEVAWNGKDLLGRELPSGIYLYRLEAGKTVMAKRMALVR